jgi:hypothetical protein
MRARRAQFGDFHYSGGCKEYNKKPSGNAVLPHPTPTFAEHIPVGNHSEATGCQRVDGLIIS